MQLCTCKARACSNVASVGWLAGWRSAPHRLHGVAGMLSSTACMAPDREALPRAWHAIAVTVDRLWPPLLWSSNAVRRSNSFAITILLPVIEVLPPPLRGCLSRNISRTRRVAAATAEVTKPFLVLTAPGPLAGRIAARWQFVGLQGIVVVVSFFELGSEARWQWGGPTRVCYQPRFLPRALHVDRVTGSA